MYFTTVFRITESFRLEKTLKIIESNCKPNTTKLPRLPLNHVPKCHVYTSFEYLQAWSLHHFPGQHVPVLNNPFRVEIFPNTQPTFSCPITCYLGEETDTHLATNSLQVVVESSKVSPQPPFLQAKQLQFPRPSS